ncbi:Inactive dipeptidyl peptidase 10 [Takifugu flavidus]|uniref:Inactive dipeptidyl peptidase 10 n=1 Tax=Takifugu flavidus TaxID=433684 RepID=A0A5C6PN67_9TELE|nr:Inactive dipeptidyl peptidase 10 [Takifugu flavidus]
MWSRCEPTGPTLVSCYIHQLPDNAGKPSGSPLTLDDLFDRNFQVHDPGAKWINDEELIFRSFDGDILKVNTRNQTELLMKNTTFATFKASKFAVSPDLNFVLLAYDIKQAAHSNTPCPSVHPPIHPSIHPSLALSHTSKIAFCTSHHVLPAGCPLS